MGFHNIPAVDGAPTKEFFVPVTYGTEMLHNFPWPVARCNANDEYAYIAFRVPHDFTAITTAEIVVICMSTEVAANWDTLVEYAAAGEARNTHTASEAAATYNVTLNEIEVVDISALLGALAADDYVGVQFRQGAAGHNADVLGVHFKYS